MNTTNLNKEDKAMIDITKGNDWELRIALTRDGEPFPVTSATGLAVDVVSPYGH